MVYLVKVTNSAKGYEGTLLALVKTENKSMIIRHLNNDLTIDVKEPGDYSVIKEVKHVSLSSPSSVTVLYYLKKDAPVVEEKVEESSEEEESKKRSGFFG